MFGYSKCISFKLATLMVLIGAAASFAQINSGKIEGYVKDQSTGQPISGAQVTVNETRLGNITNDDGYYFILNVPPGLRTITATFTGYQKTSVANQRILAGQTQTINFSISSTVVELEGITIEGESEVLVPRDNTVTKHRLDTRDMENIASDDLQSIIELQAGVGEGGQGGLEKELRFRGGRPGEGALVIDGITVKNMTAEPLKGETGGWWEEPENAASQTSIPLELSTSAVEQVDVITGGWQAEYGNVQSGIINIVTKSGGDRLRGSLRYTTDGLNPESDNYGFNRIQGNINGPIPLIPYLNFNLSAEIYGQDDMNPSHADEGYRGITSGFVDNLNNAVKNMPELGENPYTLEGFQTSHNNWKNYVAADPKLQNVAFTNEHESQLPDNWGDKTLLSGKLNYDPSTKFKILSTYNFSRNQRSLFQMDNLYNKGRIYRYGDENTNLGDEVRIINPNYANRQKTWTGLVGFNWTLFSSSEKNAELSFRYNHLETDQVLNSSQQRGWNRDTFLGWSADDIEFELEWYPNTEIRLIDPDQQYHLPDATSPEEWNLPLYSAFGFPLGVGNFGGDGYILWYDYIDEKQDFYKADFDFQWSRTNRLKTGFEYINGDNNQFTIRSWELTRNASNEFAYKPEIFGAYVQNKMDLGDFVMNIGLRYDSFDPKDNWGIRNYDLFGYYYFPKEISSVSPRFDVAFPVTDRAQLRLAYGKFSQLPSLSYIYSGDNYGDLEYQVTESFEAGLSYMLADDWVLDLVTYYKDVLGNVSTRQFWRDYSYVDQNTGDPLLNRGYTSGYTNKDRGNIKGLEIGFSKSMSNYLALNASYTLEFSRTTGSTPSDAEDETFENLDPTTLQTSIPPDQLAVIDNDRTHRLNVVATLAFPRDFNEGTGWNKVFSNFSATMTGRIYSGTPYSSNSNTYNGVEMRIGPFNAFRNRSYYLVDLRLNKNFDLNSTRLSVFAEIYNLLNRRESVQWSYNATYAAIADQYRYGHPVLDQNISEFSDVVLKAYYLSDYNGDGIMSLQEMVMGRIAQEFASSGDADPRNWGSPRQVRLGLGLSF